MITYDSYCCYKKLSQLSGLNLLPNSSGGQKSKSKDANKGGREGLGKSLFPCLFKPLLLLLLSHFSRVSPGKNTGVGCHFLLQYMKVKSESEDTQSYLTLSDRMDCSPPGSPVHGILQAKEYQSGVPLPSPSLDTILHQLKIFTVFFYNRNMFLL